MSSAKWSSFRLGYNVLKFEHHESGAMKPVWWDLGLYSLSGKTSYRQVSWSLEATRLDVTMIASLRNLTGISVALLPKCLSNFRAIGKVKTRISRLRDFARSCGEKSVSLVDRGHEKSYKNTSIWRKHPIPHMNMCTVYTCMHIFTQGYIFRYVAHVNGIKQWTIISTL